MPHTDSPTISERKDNAIALLRFALTRLLDAHPHDESARAAAIQALVETTPAKIQGVPRSTGDGQRRQDAEGKAIPRSPVGHEFHAGFWAVYAIEHPFLGFFAGWKPHEPHNTPIWCATLAAAVKFDAFEDLAAKDRALAIRDHYAPDAVVWAYRRQDAFPEKYRKPLAP